MVSGALAYPETDEISTLLDSSKKAINENNMEEGLILLDKAARLAEEQKDAEECLSVGLAYAGLPGELERKAFAVDILKKGAGFAEKEKDYTLLGKYAKAFKSLDEKDTAIKIYDEIFLYAGELKDKDVFTTLKTIYKELGDEERAGLCDKMIDALNLPPPPDWQPLGETIRNPKDVHDVSQQSQRSLADQEIQATMDYIKEKRKLHEEKENRPMPSYIPEMGSAEKTEKRVQGQ